MRFAVLIPMVCAMAGFVLPLLCMFAGSKPNFMEEFHIITLNTSTLGHQLVSTPTSSGAAATSTSSGFWSNLINNVTSEVHNISATLEGDLDGYLNDLADKLASELGIEQWYSLHLMDMCEGTYKPNATSKGASKNISSCTNQTAMYHFDLSKSLNDSLSLGPLHLNLSDISWPDDIQNGLDNLSTAIDAVFVLYAIGIAAAGLSIIFSLVAFFVNGSRLIAFGNLGLSGLSFLTLLIASIAITVVQSKAAHLINKYGNEIGAYAYKGKKYLILTWVGVGVMLVASVLWVGLFIVGHKNHKREYTEKKSTRSPGFFGRHRRSDEAQLRRSGV